MSLDIKVLRAQTEAAKIERARLAEISYQNALCTSRDELEESVRRSAEAGYSETAIPLKHGWADKIAQVLTEEYKKQGFKLKTNPDYNGQVYLSIGWAK